MTYLTFEMVVGKGNRHRPARCKSRNQKSFQHKITRQIARYGRAEIKVDDRIVNFVKETTP